MDLGSLNTLTVWTFQAEVQLQTLLREGLLQGDWSHVCPKEKAAYHFMCREMAARDLSCAGRPPVWGWHYCGGYQLIETPIVLLTLVCPSDQVLNSDYNAWCDQVYFPLCSNAAFTPSPEALQGIFKLDYTALDDAPVQAVLPSLRREWLVEARKVHLDPSREVAISEPWRPTPNIQSKNP